MDIAITLPSSLWDKIVSGEKTIELRKNFPKDFCFKYDRVYVLLKGTTKIAGFFYVSSFEKFYAESINDFDQILTKISVPKQWIINYIGYSSLVYLWHIRKVVPFVNFLDRCYIWNKKTNPQSFFYIR